jgi:hypothetical protein
LPAPGRIEEFKFGIALTKYSKLFSEKTARSTDLRIPSQSESTESKKEAMKPIRLLLLLLCSCPLALYAQTAEVGGAVQDPSGAVIPKASVEFRNQDTGVRRQTTTNNDGLYHIVGVGPGKYDATVQANGFKTLTRENVVLQVGDKAQIDFRMQVGDAGQTVTVDGSGLQINTTDASVSTVVDRQFVANMPLNGRSFQDLISMTPGVVTQSSQAGGAIQQQGDFSVNGQRTESNYYTVDGVSANVGAGRPTGGGQNATAGSIAASTALGTTQSLISVDALQEFRVSSSTYSAEYGHSPGGQFSLSTRPGTSTFHGSLFDYLRNDFFDANDWFSDHNGLKKTALHQNDFGGTLGGPVEIPRLYNGKANSFFFVSYEGLRLVQPVGATTQYVPSSAVRSSASPQIQAVLNAFPVPTGGEIVTSSGPSGLSPFVAAYSLPAKVNATSVRIDQKVGAKASVFFRYGYTPSSTSSRTLSTLFQQQQNNQTYTAGADGSLRSNLSNSLRVGFSASDSQQVSTLDAFGGATPTNFQSAFGVPGATSTYSYLPYIFSSGVGSSYLNVTNVSNKLRQWNITDVFAMSFGKHLFRFGIDNRYIVSPLTPAAVGVELYYYSRASVVNNSADYGYVDKGIPARPVFKEFAAYFQDEWKPIPALSLSYGLRWEVNPPPGAADGNTAYTALGDPKTPSTLSLEPRGTPLYQTTWYNFAPRFGAAWTARNAPGRETVLRAGGGVFFDSGTQTAGQAYSGLGFQAEASSSNVALPLPPSLFSYPTAVEPPYSSAVYLFDHHLQLPYTLEWNVSAEQAFGSGQTLTMSYVGSAGRRLLQGQYIDLSASGTDFVAVEYFPNGLTSNYQALQLKFQRSVAKGLQSLLSYTWSHSLDYGSTNVSYPLTYGNSDFDVRHNFQGGLTWSVPQVSENRLAEALLNDWGLDGRINVRSAFPITLTGTLFEDASGTYYYGGVNYNPANPIYLHGSQYPGKRAINGGPDVSSASAAFTLPAGTAEGNAARNFVRAFGATQINIAARRDFHIVDRLSLQFRAEAFNIFNHPNFGYVDPSLADLQFGQATKMLNSSLGSMSSLYQQGGPRSMQFSLKLAF